MTSYRITRISYVVLELLKLSSRITNMLPHNCYILFFPFPTFPPSLHLLHSLLQELQLPGHLVGQVVVHLCGEVLPHVLHFLLPELLIQGEELVQVHVLLQALEVQGVAAGQVAHGRGHGAGLAVHSPEHPVQHADVVAEAGPEESGGGALAEPVDVKDLGELGAGAVGHAQPVREVLSEVVAEEGTHGEGVVHDHLACRKEGGQRGEKE